MLITGRSDILKSNQTTSIYSYAKPPHFSSLSVSSLDCCLSCMHSVHSPGFRTAKGLDQLALAAPQSLGTQFRQPDTEGKQTMMSYGLWRRLQRCTARYDVGGQTYVLQMATEQAHTYGVPPRQFYCCWHNTEARSLGMPISGVRVLQLQVGKLFCCKFSLSLFLLHQTLSLRMLSHSHMNKLPPPSSFSVNLTSATMLSRTASSCIPVHVNGSVVPATASRSPVNTANDVAMLLSDESISKLNTVMPTSTASSISNASKSPLTVTAITNASKDCPPLRQHQQRSLANIAPSINFASISERIAERRRRVIANLAHGSKRPTPPVKVAQPSISKSSATSSSILPLTPITNITTTASISQLPSISSAVASAVPIISATIPVVENHATMPEPIATTAAPKPTIPAVVSERPRVIANLAHGTESPTPRIKIAQPSTLKSSSTTSNILSLIPTINIITTVSISQSPSIPSAVASAVPIISAAMPVVEIPAAMPEPNTATAVPEPTITAVVPEPAAATMPTPRRYGYVVVHMPANYRQNEQEGKSHHIERFVEISDRVWNSESLIPSASTGRKPRARLPGSFRPMTYPLTRTAIPDKLSPVFLPHTTSQLPKHFSQVYLTLRVKPDKTRGKSPYCPGRPWFPGEPPTLGYGPLRNGRNCDCRSHYSETPVRKYHIRPNKWATTPAESGVDPNPPCKKSTTRPRKVRFAENLTQTFDKVKPSDAIIRAVYETKDMTTRAQDFPDGFPLCDE